jgi:NADPH-dependent glutamate synthase beta subunit-like oxidoreductase
MSLGNRFDSSRKVPAAAVSTGTMAFNRTGNWRYLRPILSDKLAPCRGSCPAGTDIPKVLSLLAKGEVVGAYAVIRENNPLPAVCGRVCYHPCETRCGRAAVDEEVAVQSLERFISESCLDLPPEPPPSNSRSETVAVVGSGPAGLTCAHYLARQGFPVRIYEAESFLGGMLRIGIPAYRLPRAVLDREIAKIAALDIEFLADCRIGRDRSLDQLQREHAAVFVATGAHRSRLLPFAAESPRLIPGLRFLAEVNRGERPKIGKRAIVIGGGNTALDTARTALRLGARPVVVYRRSRREMPAHPSEVRDTLAEGVEIVFQASPVGFSPKGTKKVVIEFVKMQLGPPDAGGRARPVPVQGSNFSMEADTVLIAVGETPDLSFFSERPGVFLGGDAGSGPSTVVEAIAAGHAAASQIMHFLGVKPPPATRPAARFDVAALNHAHFDSAPRLRPPSLPPSERVRDFAEIVRTVGEAEAVAEAGRCLSCGVCNLCGACWAFCPEAAMHIGGERYTVDLDYCKGCGICAEECPRGVIALAEEEP